MPPLTLDSLLHGGGGEPEDECEDEFSGSDDDGEDGGGGSEEWGGDVDGEYDPYSPAESLWLRIGEDIDWSEVGAVLEREDSTKGASNPKSAAACSCAGAPAARMPTCAGGGGTAKAVVIAGCPRRGRPRGSTSGGGGARPRRARARVFAGDAVEVAEPGRPRCPASAASGRGRGRSSRAVPPRQLREAAVVVRAVVGERRVPPVLERPPPRV